MSDQQANTPEPGRRAMTIGQIVMLAVGILLLLPGACSLFFIVATIPDKPSSPFSDPYMEIFYGFWVMSFIISAAGVALIWAARKRARTPLA